MLRNALPKIVTKVLPGPQAAQIIARRAQAVPSAIRCDYPVVIDRAEGAMVADVDGNIFVDWVGGVGVLNVGYSHPDVLAAIHAQTDRDLHAMANIITHPG